MLNRTMSRTVTALAAAGTVAVLGAASAAARPAGWSGPTTVPGSSSNVTPAVTQVFVTNAAHGTLIAWKGQFNNKIHYNVLVSGKFLGMQVIPGARTAAGPAVAGYKDPNGKNAVIAVWRPVGTSKLYYAQGESNGHGGYSWTKAAKLAANTSSGPAAIFPAHAPHGPVIVAWRGPFNHVRYTVGYPVGRRFNWTPSNWISPSASVKTASAPSLAETPGPKAGTGTVYVVWKGYHSKQVRYSTTSDPLHLTGHFLTWSATRVVPGAATDSSPAASSTGARATGPLMVAYKVPHKLAVRYQTLIGPVWTAPAPVPTASTAVGPALLFGTLATTNSNSAGNVVLRFFS